MNIKQYIAIAACTLTLCGCNDWLDMPSESKADSNSVFNSVNRAEMTVVGAYSMLHTQELGYQLLMGTDETASTETNSKYNVSNYDYTNLTGILSGTYTSMYKAIEYANVCIYNLPNMSGTDEEKVKINGLLGESLAIRAYAYWNLVRFYGDVPYADTPTAYLTTFASSRVSRDTIWDRCVADLQKAVELLPWAKDSYVQTGERFTKNSAYGILARVALYAAGYSLRWDLSKCPYDQSTLAIAKRKDSGRITQLLQIAANACKAVIDRGENTLLADYDAVFRNLATKTYDSENMLQYGWFSGNDASDVRTGYTNGIPSSGTSNVLGKFAPQMVAQPTLYFDYKEGDQRRDVAVCNYGIRHTNDNMELEVYLGACAGKYRFDWMKERGASDSKRGINFPLLRYSDVLLMYAEALNELNNRPTAEAKEALKQVRMRAFRNDESKIGNIPDNYDDFFEAIKMERKLELCHESLRKSDLTRWGILYEHLTAEKERMARLCRHEGEYANVVKYKAYKPVVATLQNKYIALPTVDVTEANLTELGVTEDEMKTLNTLNDGKKGALKKKLWELDGKVYFSKPSDKAVQTEYTIVNMYGTNAIKANKGLSVDDVPGLASKNTWITDMYYGLVKNRVEIMPFHQTAIIDVNPGLKDQQHPGY
ncbi:MAG: RagB/SusD family nutrient uptake outer membrane protein [Bacteroidaceae bacterium]|nr:RagB/SusD family nutrient uptake outer membrane protein [Bacteroidaceae bacterium]